MSKQASEMTPATAGWTQAAHYWMDRCLAAEAEVTRARLEGDAWIALQTETTQREKALRKELADIGFESERRRMALEKIANGEGYYGLQAKEYKDIARAALVDTRKAA